MTADEIFMLIYRKPCFCYFFLKSNPEQIILRKNFYKKKLEDILKFFSINNGCRNYLLFLKKVFNFLFSHSNNGPN